MWVCDVARLSDQAGVRLSLREDDRSVSYAEFLEGLSTDASAARLFSKRLASLPFPAFFWEARPVCEDT
ncbi:MAG TPA: hypothetical protein VFU02_07925, partial [Polyangiaceae bacterium]|nr:hypothetical protein [Polyangiaceae bacterium]